MSEADFAQTGRMVGGRVVDGVVALVATSCCVVG